MGCISINKEFMVPKVTSLKRSSFCLSTDINFTALSFSLVKIFSFELSIVNDISRNWCHCLVSFAMIKQVFAKLILLLHHQNYLFKR